MTTKLDQQCPVVVVSYSSRRYACRSVTLVRCDALAGVLLSFAMMYDKQPPTLVMLFFVDVINYHWLVCC